jgi:hypothetical protein
LLLLVLGERPLDLSTFPTLLLFGAVPIGAQRREHALIPFDGHAGA